jgi:hypothetical protein
MRGGGRKDEENTKNDRWMKERRRPAFRRRERWIGVVMKGKDEIIGMIIVGSHMAG